MSVEIKTALEVIAKIIDRNVGYIGLELARGIFSSIQIELTKECNDVANTDTNTATKQ